MRTFKFADDKSYKFWKIELTGKGYTVNFGRIGTKGQTQTKEFATEEEARKAYEKLIAEKVSKGYEETTPATTASPAQVLERAIRDDPDDIAAHAAYADWLTQQGDPRGELIQVQLSLEDPSQPAAARTQLKKREKELLDQHARQWLGPIADYLLDQRGLAEYQRTAGGYQYEFARGWLSTLRVPSLNLEFVRALNKTTDARYLRRLYIEGTDYQEAGEYEPSPEIPEDAYNPSVYALLKFPYLESLRVFHLGEPMEGDYSNCHTEGAAAASLVERMPRIEELYLLAHRVDLNKLFSLKNLTNLRILQVYHCRDYPLDRLAKNAALGNLTHLLFYPHALEVDDEEAYISRAGVRALMRAKNLPKLTHLQLRLSDMGDDGCKEIVNSGILSRLKLLDVMHGAITDDGAKTLASSPDLKNLDLLEISYNRLTSAGIKLLREVGVNIQAQHQYQPDGDEMEYLWMGDME